MFVFCIYLFTSIFYVPADEKINESLFEFDFNVEDPLDIKGVSGAKNDPYLFMVTCILTILCTILWVKLVWIDNDPGIINTRSQDFEEVYMITHIKFPL